ncbi:hypothetical protein CDL12_05071 [Handroanthus impetiginosus]|uniref:Prolamin-like domain-containing protein n=1 Tax=Handroanthus impetiginosus TaxID=429701 RepID=A0A2G9HXH8_9LAMI|nr:hypothetical protein CDL12_05071 [Handroanthus impetiginosus]
MHGCLHEFTSSILTLQPRLVGPLCCKAFLRIDESCWPKIFPVNLAFPHSLKNYCVVLQGLPQALPPSYTTNFDVVPNLMKGGEDKD